MREGHVHAHRRADAERDRVPVFVEALHDHVVVGRARADRTGRRAGVVRLLRVVGACGKQRGEAAGVHRDIPAAVAIVRSGVGARARATREDAVHQLVGVAVDRATRRATLGDARRGHAVLRGGIPRERRPVRGWRSAVERRRVLGAEGDALVVAGGVVQAGRGRVGRHVRVRPADPEDRRRQGRTDHEQRAIAREVRAGQVASEHVGSRRGDGRRRAGIAPVEEVELAGVGVGRGRDAVIGSRDVRGLVRGGGRGELSRAEEAAEDQADRAVRLIRPGREANRVEVAGARSSDAAVAGSVELPDFAVAVVVLGAGEGQTLRARARRDEPLDQDLVRGKRHAPRLAGSELAAALDRADDGFFPAR